MFPVASPKWLRRNGTPAAPEDLTRKLLIHEEVPAAVDGLASEAAGVSLRGALKVLTDDCRMPAWDWIAARLPVSGCRWRRA